MPARQLYIGLMSGTSADAIDAALVDLTSTPQLIASFSQPIPAQLKRQIHAIALPGDNEIDRMGSLDVELGQRFASCVKALIDKAGILSNDILAIGSHGQTIRHRPPGSAEGTFTLQIGDPNVIAELTGITTVADFRRRDMAAGGQGAPLVPAFHRAIFSSGANYAVINIGGMANVTWLPVNGDIIGFDTGPGNVLMDTWIQEHLQKPFDKDGAWAASGKVIPELLSHLLCDPFFSQPFPKSTGREYFNRQWIAKHLQALKQQPYKEDVQATLLLLTAITVSDSIKSVGPSADEVLICGGGAFNRALMGEIQRLLPSCKVRSTAHYGVDPQWIEAMAFGWLAKQTINHKPGNLCAVTGAKREVILGGIYYA